MYENGQHRSLSQQLARVLFLMAAPIAGVSALSADDLEAEALVQARRLEL
jgi:hypothetical protein